MNISTYESRIKALEDQLNPPAPSGRGILSVTVTPDIPLYSGETLNEHLSHILPIEEGTKSETLIAQNALINDNMYEVSADPGGDWRINAGSGFGLPGVNGTGTANVANGALKINIISASDPSDQTAPYAQIRLTIAGGE